MEQQSKYYTPDISELHVGYELEVEDFNRGHENGVQWVKTVIEHGANHERNTHEEIFDGTTIQGIEARNDVYIRNTYRTKYLDQSDAATLGWTDIEDIKTWMGVPPMYSWSARFKNMMMAYNSTDHTLVMMVRDPTRNPQNTADEYNYPEVKYGMFRGDCKSINELRKIMEWLNIK